MTAALAACTQEIATDISDDDRLLAEIEFTRAGLISHINEAKTFLSELTSGVFAPEGMIATTIPDWAVKLVRRSGTVDAVLEKIGSNRFAKRRPSDITPFRAHVAARLQANAPLILRVVFGPLKNMNRCGCRQDPDWAEYLALAQLARVMQAVSCVYPHGIQAEIVPDDLRARAANNCPEAYTAQYIAGLQALTASMGLEGVMRVESGEARLYDVYNVTSFRAQADAELHEWRKMDPEAFGQKWETALMNAGKNLACAEERTMEEIENSAWNYLVAHRAEILSGMWGTQDAFPVCYANHPGNYQLYTLGFKKTKLPWQVEMPLSLTNTGTCAENSCAA